MDILSLILTGSGAYMISGGVNGGAIDALADALNGPLVGAGLTILGLLALLLPATSILIGIVFWFALFMSFITLVSGVYDLYKSKCPISDVFGFGLVTVIFAILGFTKIQSIAAWIGFSAGMIGFYLPDTIKEAKNCGT